MDDYGLLETIRLGDLAQVKHIFLKKIKIKARMKDIILSTLQRTTGGNKDVPFLLATTIEDWSILAFFVTECGIDINQRVEVDLSFRESTYAIIAAIKANNAFAFDWILNNGGDPTVIDGRGWTPLHHSVACLSYSFTKRLILVSKEGIDLENSDGETVLHLASKAGHVELVRLLIDFGKSHIGCSRSFDGMSPIHIAAKEGNYHLVQMFCERYNVNPKSQYKCKTPSDARSYVLRSPLHVAAAEGNFETVKILLKFSEPNVLDSLGNTPLHCCFMQKYCEQTMKSMNDYRETAKLLFEHGVNPNILNNREENAIDLARINGYKFVIDFMNGKKGWSIDREIEDDEIQTFVQRSSFLAGNGSLGIRTAQSFTNEIENFDPTSFQKNSSFRREKIQKSNNTDESPEKEKNCTLKIKKNHLDNDVSSEKRSSVKDKNKLQEGKKIQTNRGEPNSDVTQWLKQQAKLLKDKNDHEKTLPVAQSTPPPSPKKEPSGLENSSIKKTSKQKPPPPPKPSQKISAATRVAFGNQSGDDASSCDRSFDSSDRIKPVPRPRAKVVHEKNVQEHIEPPSKKNIRNMAKMFDQVIMKMDETPNWSKNVPLLPVMKNIVPMNNVKKSTEGLQNSNLESESHILQNSNHQKQEKLLKSSTKVAMKPVAGKMIPVIGDDENEDDGKNYAEDIKPKIQSIFQKKVMTESPKKVSNSENCHLDDENENVIISKFGLKKHTQKMLCRKAPNEKEGKYVQKNEDKDDESEVDEENEDEDEEDNNDQDDHDYDDDNDDDEEEEDDDEEEEEEEEEEVEEEEEEDNDVEGEEEIGEEEKNYIDDKRIESTNTRTVFITKNSDKKLGFSIIGGNHDGIFIHTVHKNPSLKSGDRIVEVNGRSVEGKTKEEVYKMFEAITATMDKVALELTNDRLDLYQDMIKNGGGGGDRFYVRAKFTHDSGRKKELKIREGEVFFVSDTFPEKFEGMWKAQRISTSTRKTDDIGTGFIPNRQRADQLAIKQHLSNNRNSGFMRSFRRTKSAERIAQKNGKLNESVDAFNSSLTLVGYERVMQAPPPSRKRPVVILGLFCDVVVNMLAQDSPDLFFLPPPSVQLEASDGDFDDAPVDIQIMQRLIFSPENSEKRHLLIILSPQAIDFIVKKTNFDPIVIFISPVSKAVVKAVKGKLAPHYDKNSSHLYEEAAKFEKAYSHLFSAIVSYTTDNWWFFHVKDTVNQMQQQNIWIPEELALIVKKKIPLAPKPATKKNDTYPKRLMSRTLEDLHHFNHQEGDSKFIQSNDSSKKSFKPALPDTSNSKPLLKPNVHYMNNIMKEKINKKIADNDDDNESIDEADIGTDGESEDEMGLVVPSTAKKPHVSVAELESCPQTFGRDRRLQSETNASNQKTSRNLDSPQYLTSKNRNKVFSRPSDQASFNSSFDVMPSFSPSCVKFNRNPIKKQISNSSKETPL